MYERNQNKNVTVRQTIAANSLTSVKLKKKIKNMATYIFNQPIILTYFTKAKK